MITLEQACEIYEQQSDWPIRAIVESDTEWAFFEATNGFTGIEIPVVDKKTGECEWKTYFDYEKLPMIPIPAKYKKERPRKIYPSGLEAFVGPLYYTDGTRVRF